MTDNESLPFVSVIIPVRNEAAFIERCLTSIFDQSYPKDRLEIIIADGMSTDRTRQIIDEIARDRARAVIVVDNVGRIAPTGLNRAIERSVGEIIIRIDGHCEIDVDYVKNCVTLLGSDTAEGVGGPIETVADTPGAEAISIAMSSKFGVGGSAFRTISHREMFTDTVAFPGYTREIINRAGPFDEELVRNQDDEYNYRIRSLGGRILLSPKIRSRYFSRSNLRSLWRQYYQYGYWKVRVLQLHPRQMRLRQFVPFILVSTLILLTALSFLWPGSLWILAAVIGAYLLANFVASAFEGKAQLRISANISICFFILHFAYGLGWLTGLYKFRNRWKAESGIVPTSYSG